MRQLEENIQKNKVAEYDILINIGDDSDIKNNY